MTNDIPPLNFQWDGEFMIPALPKRADRHYVVGMDYRLIPHEERSWKSHGHYFASINDAFKTLPEAWAERFATPDHLRKWSLIKTGYRDESAVVCASKAEALRIAAFIRPMDDYAIITVSECTVIVYTAKSQSMRAMGRTDFQLSKDKVLDIIAGMIEVEPETLKQNAGQTA